MVRITLGAGHGGYDCGTVGADGLAEKDLSLYLSGLIRRRLCRVPSFEPLQLRMSDLYLSTAERADFVFHARSRCHIELHLDLTPDSLKCGAVWYSADIPTDRAAAAKLSQKLSRACGVPDCGARVRFDYCALFKKIDGFEDYYSLIEALGMGGLEHVFYCECGFDPGLLRKEGFKRIAARMADAVLRFLCGLYRQIPPAPFPFSDPPSPYAGPPSSVYLKAGFYHIRAGPGPYFASVGTALGLAYVGVYGNYGGWVRISPTSCEYLSATAVEMVLHKGPEDPPLHESACGYEAVGPESAYLVLSMPRPGAGVLGAVGCGARFGTEIQSGFRRIRFGDRPGFIAASAFRKTGGRES